MSKISGPRRVAKRTHIEHVVTVTDRFGELEISSSISYLDALRDVIRHADMAGGRLEPSGSDSWNLYQTGATPRINIIRFEVLDES